MACAIFKKADNDEGFISVLCHRERYLDLLKAEGWVLTLDEALAQTETVDTDTEKAALVEQAKELGIKRAGNMSVERLQEEIAKHDSSINAD